MSTNPSQQVSASPAASQPAVDRSILSPGSSYFLLQDPAHLAAPPAPAAHPGDQVDDQPAQDSDLERLPLSSRGHILVPATPAHGLTRSVPTAAPSVAALGPDDGHHAAPLGSSEIEATSGPSSPAAHTPAVALPAADNPASVHGSAVPASSTPPPRARTRLQNNIVQPKNFFQG